MSDNDSENDQGFVSNKIQIEKQELSQQRLFNQSARVYQRPENYQPRFIASENIIKKQPPYIQNIGQRIREIPLPPKDKQIQAHQPNIKHQSHPYHLYFQNPNFKLVFSRGKQRQIDEFSDYFAKNQVSLNSLPNNVQNKFMVLKPYDENFIENNGDQLEFDSKFQGGNLQWAFRKKESHQYTLFTQNDTNSYGYNQWFYFSLQNTRPDINYHFQIVNFKKKHSFFTNGKRLAVFSKINNIQTGQGWTYSGHNITYQKSTISSNYHKYYSLSFDLAIHHLNDHIFIALNLPYSYSRLMQNLTKFSQLLGSHQRINWQMKTIGYTLGNNAVPYITMSSSMKTKKVILILGRQHSGQTWSSYLMEELIKGLMSEREQAKWILQNFTIKIFPMINVDGVIYGNSRCDLAGFDLNRNWKSPCSILHPQIYAIKEQIQQIAKKYQIECCLDLHGHSKEYNTFCYSCKHEDKNQKIDCRILPYIFSQINRGFDFLSCTFGIEKYKQSTARGTIYNLIKKQNVLTIQSSFYGQKIQNHKPIPYDPLIIRDMSITILKGLKIYFNNQQTKTKVREKITASLNKTKQYQIKDSHQACSESDPEGDQIALEQKIGKVFDLSILNHLPSTIFNTMANKNIMRSKQKQEFCEELKQYKKKENSTSQIQPFKSKKLIIPQKINKQSKAKTLDPSQSKQITKKHQSSLATTPNKQTKTNFQSKVIQRRRSKLLQTYQNNPKKFSQIGFKQSQGLQDQSKNSSIDSQFNSFQGYHQQGYHQQGYHQQEYDQQGSNHEQTKGFGNFRQGRPNQISEKRERKIYFTNQKPESNEQFPPLCIMSEKKRNFHKMKKTFKLQSTINEINYPSPKSSRRAQIYKRSKRQKKNSEILSKLWLDNIAKYGKKRTIFFGDNLDDYN